MKVVGRLLPLGLLVLTACAIQPRVKTEEQACRLVKARVVTVHRYSGSQLGFCDPGLGDDDPPNYFVLALHSNRRCEDICSTNLGYFAVRKSTGEVLDWDVAESKLEGPVRN